MHAHLLLALLLAMPLFQEPAEISASTPSARCTWASEDPQALLVRLRSGMELSGGDGAYSAWSRWVESHAANHAWSGRFDGPDPFAVRKIDCPAAILDAIASVQDLTDEYRAPSLYVELALVLERNGRVDSALGMLKNAVEVAKQTNAWTQVARLAEQAAKLYARHGLWAKAEEQSTGWIPYAQCGNCLPSEKRRIAEFRAHCLVELGRWDDAREVVRKQAMRTDGLTGSLAECYIRASVARGGS
ncbi:MAG TPA: tetratricopeptide repeat protein, partial [Planctomycetota bacterium]|nr:tetratricopeptide repeat protein [Planctomycetota bacterium]